MTDDVDDIEARVSAEAERIRKHYKLMQNPATHALYRPVNQFQRVQAMRVSLTALSRRQLLPLTGKRILDVGCRQGNWLLDFIQWGANPNLIAGIDLADEQIEIARERVPAADIRVGDASSLPWPDGAFDLVSQYVVFTSVLDDAVRARIASEMVRVTKPGGHILWYDFSMNNPRNPGVRGVKASAIHRMFAGCEIDLRRSTLAPPLARLIVPMSWPLGVMLESVPFLCTHYLGIIRKPG